MSTPANFKPPQSNMMRQHRNSPNNENFNQHINAGTQHVSQNFDNNTNKVSYANVLTPLINNQINNSQIPKTIPSIPNPNKNLFNKKPDYSEDNNITPKKDQGIVIEAVEGLKIKQYLETVGEIVGPDNIIYASRLSRERICMYMKSKELVNEITEKFDAIIIDENELQIRPLLLRSTKYYINRICPSIPSSFLHDIISNQGINITSKIQREKMSHEENNFSHVYSFRRTFYGLPNKNVTIPESILFKYEHENHRIYISTEMKRCFNCFKIGHLAEVCNKKDKNLINTETENEKESQINTNASQNLESMNLDLCLSSKSLNINDVIDTDMTDISEVNRPDNNNENDSEGEDNVEQKKKKQKITNTQNLNATEELERAFVNYVHSDIDFNAFANFLNQISKKKIDDDDMRVKYSKQIAEFMEIIETLRGATQSGTKARLTRAVHKIKEIFINKSNNSQSNEVNTLSLYDELQNNTMESL